MSRGDNRSSSKGHGHNCGVDSFAVFYSGTPFFAALIVVYSLIGSIPHHDLPSRLAQASVFAAGMSAILYVAWFLSPRNIDSGPRGIAVTKANEILLIPWQAIASFQFSRTVLPGSLSLQLHSGEEYTIGLAHNAHVTEIGKEIAEMSGAQV